VPTVVAVDTSYRSGPWSYLLQEHVDGLEWRRLRRLLAPEQVRNALRVADPRQRATFLDVRDRKSSLFADQARSTLCHDDLQHTNLIFRPGRAGWHLAAVLDWDKAWAGPSESDIARMSVWDDMTAAGFWEVYSAVAPPAEGRSERALVLSAAVVP
jgi:aminoglycoside phosphotransferase (APT) family kinase protein